MPKPRKIEYEKRITEVAEMLVSGLSRASILRITAEKWNLEERAGDYLIARADEKLAKEAEASLREVRGLIVGRFEHLFTEASEKGDIRSRIQILRELAEIYHLKDQREEKQSVTIVVADSPEDYA